MGSLSFRYWRSERLVSRGQDDDLVNKQKGRIEKQLRLVAPIQNAKLSEETVVYHPRMFHGRRRTLSLWGMIIAASRRVSDGEVNREGDFKG